MKRFFLVLGLLAALTALESCGGGSSTTSASTTPTITVSCAATQVVVLGTVQCTATVQNLSSTSVSWSVNGGAANGMIDSNGKYMAPATVPASNVVTITAAAVAQASLTGTATITIMPATAINIVTCVDPLTAAASSTVSSGKSLACTAADSTGAVVSVFWSVSSALGGNIGTISQGGIYIAPLVPPPGQTVTITATSQAVSTLTKSVVITVIFGNAVLQGSYAFSMSGTLNSNGGFFTRAGDFTADGSGRFLGGVEDINQPAGVTQEVPFTANYSIGPDGRGTVQFCEGITSACIPGATTSIFRIVVLSTKQAQIIEFDAFVAAIGEADLQDPSIFNDAGFSGTFTFDFSGISSSLQTESVVGELSANGSGSIPSGEMDVNNGGTLTPQLPIQNTSIYSVSANGRGTATIVTSTVTLHFSFYMVSSSRAKFIGLDAVPVLIGDAFKQQTIAQWPPNALDGEFAFETSGSVPGVGGVADAGHITTDGKGGIVAGSGVLDQNSHGTVTGPTAVSGSYANDSIGRGTLTLTGHTYVFYMISTSSAVVQETTQTPLTVADGVLAQQQGGPFALTAGSYALSLAGETSTGLEDLIGQLTADGNDNFPSGLADITGFRTTIPAEAVTGTYGSADANGRLAPVNLNPLTDKRNFVLYFVSPTQAFVLGVDSTRLAIGALYKQF